MKTSWPSNVRASGEAHSFIRFLRDHYESRRVKNARYSLRAFAKYLGIDHSTLSQLLRGKRKLTNEMILRIGQRLGLSREMIDSYLSPERRELSSAANPEESSRQLAIDTFEVISDWHHFALLELTHLNDFKPDVRRIARTLGVTVDAVNIAIQRLLRLGLLLMREDGTWEDRSMNATMSENSLSDVVRGRVQTEAHELAVRAIEMTPPDRRDHASITVALNVRRLPQIAALISQFRRDLEEIVGRDEEKDDVYRIDVSVFPITTLHHIHHETENDHD